MSAIAADVPAARWLRHSGNAASRGRIATLILTPRCAAPLARSRGAATAVGRLAVVAFIALAAAFPAAADVKLDVGGEVEAADETLDVRVDVSNTGDVAVATLEVRGEIGGDEDLVSLPTGVPAGAVRSALFQFPRVPPAGIHVLGLRLDYTATPPGRTTVTTSQRAYLLLSLGANPPTAVRLTAGEVTIDTRGMVPVRLESADGAAHRVRVRVLTPRGLNPGPPAEVDVPASGSATADVAVLRGSIPRPSRQGVLVVAETLGDETPQASVATTLVHVEAFRSVLTVLRWPLGLLSIALLAGAAAVEVRSRRRAAAVAGNPEREPEPEPGVRPSS